MKKASHGSCHCGAVRFDCQLDLAEGTSKCNCSICTKTRFWKATVKAEGFRLLLGEDALPDYRFGGGAIHHLFCSRCGVKSFGSGDMEELGASSTPSTLPAWTSRPTKARPSARHLRKRLER
jgi:hypothetical protein